MVTDFSYFHLEKWITLPIALGDASFFSGNDKENIISFYNNSGRHGIKWKFEGKEIIKSDVNSSIIGYPSPDLKYVIAIFLGKNDNFKAPKNAVVYNGDGTSHLILNPPAFKSDLIIRNIILNGDSNPPVDLSYDGALFFDQTCWTTVNGKNEMTIRMIYDQEWYETRLIEVESGRFGDVVNFGRL